MEMGGCTDTTPETLGENAVILSPIRSVVGRHIAGHPLRM